MDYRNVFSWIIGIITFILLYLISEKIFSFLGLPSFIHYDEPVLIQHRYYEEESDGSFTALGISRTILAIMVSYRVGAYLYYLEIEGNLTNEERIGFKAWFIGIATYGALGFILDFAFGYEEGWHQIIANTLELVIIGVCFVFFKDWRDKKLDKLKI